MNGIIFSIFLTWAVLFVVPYWILIYVVQKNQDITLEDVFLFTVVSAFMVSLGVIVLEWIVMVDDWRKAHHKTIILRRRGGRDA
jgi:hypothetical protein